MEPEIKAFLLRIVQSLSMALLWMLVNMTIGIYFNLAFFDDHISIWNIIYYVFLIATFLYLLKYLKNKWKDFKEAGE